MALATRENSGVSRLQTPTDLKAKATAQIAETLNALVADSMALYFKTKNFHWHLSGRDFKLYHEMFDEQAEQIFEGIDVLAERVRKLGHTTIRSMSHASKLQTIKDDHDEFVGSTQMVERLLTDNRLMAEAQRKASALCSELGDTATASILDDMLDETERRIWFLYETAQE